MLEEKLYNLGFRLNKYGKIIIGENEVYYGCLIAADSRIGVAKIRVVPWKYKDMPEKEFEDIPVAIQKLHIKYSDEVNQ
jgi:hypothetical protein